MSAALITDLVEDVVGELQQLVDDEFLIASAESTPEQAAEYVRAVRAALAEFAAAFQARVDSMPDTDILII